MTPRDQVEDTVIEGVLIPVRWDSNGEVCQVSLMAFDEAEYRIDLEAAENHSLRNCLRKHIRIRGRARGGRVVGVTSVEVLETAGPKQHQGT